jgi:hypothetical protein
MEKSTRGEITPKTRPYFPRGKDWHWIGGIFHYIERVADSVDKNKERINHYELLPNAFLLAAYNAVLTLPFYILAKEGIEGLVK